MPSDARARPIQYQIDDDDDWTDVPQHLDYDVSISTAEAVGRYADNDSGGELLACRLGREAEPSCLVKLRSPDGRVAEHEVMAEADVNYYASRLDDGDA